MASFQQEEVLGSLPWGQDLLTLDLIFILISNVEERTKDPSKNPKEDLQREKLAKPREWREMREVYP